MPWLRGVDVSLVTYPAKQVIQEYPHPDGASVRLVTRQEAANALYEGLSSPWPSPVTPSVPDRKTDPKVSVYIATQPGSQFIIQYNITKVPDCKYMNFKIIINGRHMATCGQDLAARPNGIICETLWAPSGQWDEQAGFEGRQFMFLADQKVKSAAEDGGLIEIQVFRADARQSCAPAPAEYRVHPQYGVATPSTGLVDKPEDMKWFKYRLVDPKDSPYARFFFHYRSFESLKELSLVPEHILLDQGRTANSSTGLVFTQQPQQSSPASRSGSPSPESSYISCMDGAADDDRPATSSSSRTDRQQQPRDSRPWAQGTRRDSNTSESVQAGPSDNLARGARRPLPEPPLAPAVPTRTKPKSPAPSLTPSLKMSVDAGDFDDDVEIAEPKVVKYNRVAEKPVMLDVGTAGRDSPPFDLSREHTTIYRPPRATESRLSNRATVGTAQDHDHDSFSSRTERTRHALALTNLTGRRERSPQRPESSRTRESYQYRPDGYGAREASRTRENYPHRPAGSGGRERSQQRPESSRTRESYPQRSDRHGGRESSTQQPGGGRERSRQRPGPSRGHESLPVPPSSGRRPVEPLDLNIPSGRAPPDPTTRSQRSQHQPSPYRQRPTEPQRFSQPPPPARRPVQSTYNALRDAGNAMLGVVGQPRSDPQAESSSSSAAAARTPARFSADIASPTTTTTTPGGRGSTPSWSSRFSGRSAATPTPTRAASSLEGRRGDNAEQPEQPRRGRSWRDVFRISPRLTGGRASGRANRNSAPPAGGTVSGNAASGSAATGNAATGNTDARGNNVARSNTRRGNARGNNAAPGNNNPTVEEPRDNTIDRMVSGLNDGDEGKENRPPVDPWFWGPS